MTVVLFDGTLGIHYGFGSITARNMPTPDLNKARAGQVNGLLGAGVRGTLTLTFGLHTGQVPLRIEWNEASPTTSQDWEEVVEASFNLTSRKLRLSAFEDSIELNAPAVGPHRARFCANGMDAARALDSRVANEPAPDSYLLQLWPAPTGPDEVLRQSSSCAAYWHRVARGEDQPMSPEEGDFATLFAAFRTTSDEARDEALVYIIERVISATGLSEEPAAQRVPERFRRGEVAHGNEDELYHLARRLRAEAPAVSRTGSVDVHNMAWRRVKAASVLQGALSYPRRDMVIEKYGPLYQARWALDDLWPSTRTRVAQILAE